MEEELYFVYGTLKKGMKNHGVLERLKPTFIYPVETIEKYPMFDLGNGFPYIQDTKGTGLIIQGELYSMKVKHRDTLDYFEGVPSLYKRGKVNVEIENKIYKDVNCYFISDELDKYELQQVQFFDEWTE